MPHASFNDNFLYTHSLKGLSHANQGCRRVSLNFKVLAKFGLCSNCSQKLDECSLARARKIFATARVLGFSLKLPYEKTF